MYTIQNNPLCKSVNRIRLEILTFGQARVDPQWFGSVISPMHSRLYYITDGSFSIRSPEGEKATLEKGNWYLIPAGYSFDYACDNMMEHFFFHVKICDFDGADLLRSCEQPLCLTPEENADCDFMTKCLNATKLTDGLLLQQTVFRILILFIEKHGISISVKDYTQCTYKALAYIKQNLSMQLTTSEIAKNIFVSKSTLTKHFKKELNMSVNEYITNAIMTEAVRLLMTSDIPICELSQKFGYSDQLYFSRRFKEKFGKCPREYRKENPL